MNILLMGMPKSGKTSIQKVVFQKMSPHETFFLLPTTSVERQDVNNNPNIEFSVMDFPGNHTLKADASALVRDCGALVYVIDAQAQDYENACVRFRDLIIATHQLKPGIAYEVFIHKVDQELFSTDEQKMDCLHEIQQNMRSQLSQFSANVSISFQLTSIYDHTIYEALSKVVQKLLPQVSFVTSMLDTLIEKSRIQKAFLFDVISKIYISTDSSPVDMKQYEICSELIDVLIDVTCIYGNEQASGNSKFDNKSSSIIKLQNANDQENVVMYLREVDRCLALVCLISQDDFHKQHLINYNIDMFKAGLKELFTQAPQQLKEEATGGQQQQQMQ